MGDKESGCQPTKCLLFLSLQRNMVMTEFEINQGSNLPKQLHKHLGKCPWTSQACRKKQDNWPKVNKDQEGLSSITDLHYLLTALLLTQDACTPLLLCLCLVSDLLHSSSLESVPIPFLYGCISLPCFLIR